MRLQKGKKNGLGKSPARTNLHNSENKLQPKLNQTRVGVAVVGRNLAKSIIPRPRIGAVEAGPRDAKLRVIEQIEEFGSEFKTDSFSNRRALEYGEIKVVDSGSAQ